MQARAEATERHESHTELKKSDDGEHIAVGLI